MERKSELIADEADRLQKIRDEAAGVALAIQLQVEEEEFTTRRVRRKKICVRGISKGRGRKGVRVVVHQDPASIDSPKEESQKYGEAGQDTWKIVKDHPSQSERWFLWRLSEINQVKIKVSNLKKINMDSSLQGSEDVKVWRRGYWIWVKIKEEGLHSIEKCATTWLWSIEESISQTQQEL